MEHLNQNRTPDDSVASEGSERQSSGRIALARDVEQFVAGGRVLSSSDLFALAAERFGGTLAEGAFSPRDAYDTAELGLHLHLLLGAGVLPDAPDEFRDTLAGVERLAALLPTQTRRTVEQNDFQQFSTPAPYAALCAWISGVGEGSRVIEPSAGTGALCVFALAAGASVHANELSARQADLLRVLLNEAGQDAEGSPRGTLTREDADHLDAVLPASVKADIVLLNPPFSQTAGRLGRRRVPTVGTEHVLQALCRLDPGGRLVAILSAGVERSKTMHRAFFEAIQSDPFCLRADVEVGGAVYRPNGASVRTRLLVIDRAPASGVGERLSVKTLAEAVDLLGTIRVRKDRRFCIPAL